MTEQLTIDSSEALAREDLASGAFAVGQDRGYWRLLSFSWPHAVIAVTAESRADAPSEYALRFDLSGYPQAPTAQPWDAVTELPLPPARWPAGGQRVTRVFNPQWQADALYMPLDRKAIAGHPVWLTQQAELWDTGRDLSQYLYYVRDLLRGEGYTGVRTG